MNRGLRIGSAVRLGGLGAFGIRGGGASDTIPPTVTITSSATSPSINATVTQTMTFSEDVTGFAVGDITISAGGSLASFTTVSAKIYTVVWTLAVGANTMDIAQGVCVDGAGNGNTAATQFPMTYGITTPAISPTLGNELVVNGDFAAWTGGNPDSWTVTGETGATREVTQVGAGEGHGGVGTGKCNFYTDAAFTLYISQNILTTNSWYRFGGTADTVVSGNTTIQDPIGALVSPAFTTASTKFACGNCHGQTSFMVLANAVGTNITMDDVSCKLFTFSTMNTLLGTATQHDGTYTCLPTVELGHIAGMMICYTDANNFVMAIVNYINKSGTPYNMQLYKCVAGVYTRLLNVSANDYAAGRALTVVVSGTTYKLYYNGTQRGTDQTISGMNGAAVYGFSTSSGSTPGVVTVNPT